MKAVRLRQANWLADWIAGDAGDIRILTEQQAYEAVVVHKIANYAPEYDPVSVTPPVSSTPPAEKPEVIEFPAMSDAERAHAEWVRSIEEDPDDTPEPSPAEEDFGEDPEVKMPWVTHSKAEWIRWAAYGNHQGPHISEQVAAAMTKSELMSRYGERL